MGPELTVAGWFVSKLINELVDCGESHMKKLGLEAELERLEKHLPKVKAVLNNIDQDLIRKGNPDLEKWLWQLRDAVDQASNVMDDMEYRLTKEKMEGGKNKVGKAISIVKTFLEGVVDKKPVLKSLKKAVKKIDEVAADVDKFHMLMQDLVNEQKDKVEFVMKSRDTTSVLKLRTCVFGREEEKMNIIWKLLNPKYKNKKVNFAVLPLVGAGGIGKTTLAQYVYNDWMVKKHFELRMWVCVSNNFDRKLLTKKLYESAFGVVADLLSADKIEIELVEKLESKRFLVVFDDACNDNDINGWEELFGLLKYGKSGSMILLTTREERVATLTGAPNLMDSVFLRGLHKDDMWDLFKECAFGDEDPSYHEQLVKIGRNIVDKKLTMGSPLAAKTVGVILRSKLTMEHWTSVLNNELWSLKLGYSNDKMPAYLRLTYHYLPSHLKSCFSFCSIFPQDHVFIKDDLIYMWIALGLVPRDFNAEEKPEDVGSRYFKAMLDSSIFSIANPVSNTNLRYPAYTYHHSGAGKRFAEGYIMHDLMHDLCVTVAQGECCRCNLHKLKSVPTTVRHLFIHVGDCGEFELSKSLMNVRTLILQFDDSDPPKQDFINKLVEKMKNLRVLTLFALTLSEVPKGISDLLHLRYLSLSSYMLKVFPQSMSRLYLLETLVCGGHGSNGQADVLVMLINMRHLIASESFVDMIPNIGKLTSLHELSFRVGRETGFEICQLRDMKELRNLSISNINVVDNHEEAIEAKLRDKDSLRKLSLQWNADNFDEKVFDNLEPHSGLKELRITDYMGEKPPIWWKDQSSTSESLPLLQKPKQFKCLEKLTISNCYKLKLPHGYLNDFISLKKLDVIGCSNLVSLAKAFSKKHEQFPALKELEIAACPKLHIMPPLPRTLENLYLSQLGLGVLPNLCENLSSESGRLSSLVTLRIEGCTNLLSLAKGLLQKPELFPALDELVIHACRKLMYFPEGGFNKFISLKDLTITSCPNFVVPPIPLTLERLYLSGLKLDVIPNLCENQSSESGSLSSLVCLRIYACHNIVSLAEGLLQKPEQFPALKDLSIGFCKKLMYSPEGGFDKFISLKDLKITSCPNFVMPSIPLTIRGTFI